MTNKQADELADITADAWRVKTKLQQLLGGLRGAAVEDQLQEAHDEAHGAAIRLDEIIAEHAQ